MLSVPKLLEGAVVKMIVGVRDWQHAWTGMDYRWYTYISFKHLLSATSLIEAEALHKRCSILGLFRYKKSSVRLIVSLSYNSHRPTDPICNYFGILKLFQTNLKQLLNLCIAIPVIGLLYLVFSNLFSPPVAQILYNTRNASTIKHLL